MRSRPGNTLLVLLITLATFSAKAANSYFVEIFSTTFTPSSISINAGDTITWINQEDELHTVTSDTGAWTSQTLNWSEAFSHTFSTPGTYNYRCQIGGFTGVVTVVGNTPPTVAITSPTNNTTFASAPASFIVSATASDANGTVTSVQFMVDGTTIGTDTTSPYSVAANSVAAGPHTLRAIATDNAGAKTTNSINITVNGGGTPPTVSITSPANNTVYSNAPATFTVTANASDAGGSVTSVQFKIGSTTLGTDTTSPYSMSANNIAAGTHTLYAIATDNSGAKTTNTSTVIVNSAPIASITNPTNGAVFRAPYSATIQATASDSDGSVTNVMFILNGSTIAQDTTAPYSAALSNLSAGTYNLTVRSYDNRGTYCSQTSTFRVITNAAITGTARVAGQFQITASVVPSQVYVFEGTTNFTTWTPITTITAAVNTVTFTDTQSASFANRFYRVRSE